MDAKSEYLETISTQLTTSAGIADFPPAKVLLAIASLASQRLPDAMVMNVDLNSTPIRWHVVALVEHLLIEVAVETDHWSDEEGQLVVARAVPLSKVASLAASSLESRGAGSSVPWGVGWTAVLTNGDTIPVTGKRQPGRAAAEALGTRLLELLR